MRLIDADALMERYKKEKFYDYLVCTMIGEAPTIDAVPVVRCNACVNCVVHRLRNGEVYYYKCDFYDIEVGEGDYCSAGERKDGDCNG